MKLTNNDLLLKPKTKGISNVLKLKKMLQSAINNAQTDELTHNKQIINNNCQILNFPPQTHCEINQRSILEAKSKQKTPSNRIRVLSNSQKSLSNYVSNKIQRRVDKENMPKLINTIKHKSISRNKSSVCLPSFAINIPETKLTNELIGAKSSREQRKIKIIDAPIVKQKMAKSQSSHELFHEKFKKLKKNAEVLKKESSSFHEQNSLTPTHSIKSSFSIGHTSKINLKRFNLGKKLGRGRFGNVFIAEQKATGLLFALKIINKSQLKEANMEEQLLQQIKIQLYMDHPNILKLYCFFSDEMNIYLLLELGEQCLFKVLRKKVNYQRIQMHFAERDTAYFTKQILQGLKYLHSQKIIHRDLKPENIMLVNNVIKIADFGWSVYQPQSKRQTFCGTLDYVPPEIVRGDSYDESVDVWSLGILIYQLAIGRAPFEGNDSEQETFKKIIEGKYYIPERISPNLNSLIKQILKKDPQKRMYIKEIDNSTWLKEHEKLGRSIMPEIWSFWAS